MCKSAWVLGLLGLGMSWIGTASAEPPAGAPVEVKIVKYQEMLNAIRQLRGKVLVVDFWADTCLICKKEFPNLVQMNRKYGPLGLAAVSVCLDDPSQPGATDKVVRFLRSQNATFTNFILNEKPEFWQEKLNFDGPPSVFVFDRQGEIKKQFKDEFSYADVEKLALELLAKK